MTTTTDYVGHRAAGALARDAQRLAKRRLAQFKDARDFLWNGDKAGRHVERCVYALACEHDSGCRREGCQPCSRDYDPMPYPEAAPEPAREYAGTGVGALYGLPGTEQHLWQLAGWSVASG